MTTARRFSLPATALAAALILTGCSLVSSDSDKLGYEPEVRAVRPAEDEVNAISSQLLDWMGVKGKVTESGAMAGTCDAVDPDFQTHYSVEHPWSVYDLTSGTFEQAMQNLREKLPRNGWEITRDGLTKSQARNPEIVAVNRKTHHGVHIEWTRSRSGKLPKLITVDVGSRCYKAPEGTKLGRAS
ncbi:hypothetical protein [Streptomyces eurocidicus]|uniref:Lipoprotein n=2 Tax=Streptomyces eurocidicus TaxID=66423 RepID=A0A7W8F3P4_STREU|nr:hypothetical protein [Streptomyces eurocidicus]MBB5120857.1 hypothetical protein [Streptomyces eurocidicus]